MPLVFIVAKSATLFEFIEALAPLSLSLPQNASLDGMCPGVSFLLARRSCLPLSDPRFTPKQGQYLAFIYAYTQVLGRPPAEADLQRHFRVSPPSVHQMVLTLERAGLIRRTVGGARSIEVLVDPEALPVLRPAQEQPVKSSVQRY